MRYTASEKLEIIRTVETSYLPVRKALDTIGIPKTTFYVGLDRYAAAGFDALEDCKPRAKRGWNRIADEVRDRIIVGPWRSRNSRRARSQLYRENRCLESQRLSQLKSRRPRYLIGAVRPRRQAIHAGWCPSHLLIDF